MNAVEKIQAAIERLEEFNAIGYWETNGWLVEGGGADEGPTPLTNDPLIVTLHRTIDAQLAILRECLDFYANSQAIGMPDSEMAEYYGNTLDLAEAILA